VAHIEEALKSILEDASAVTDLVGTRIYPVMLPQGVTFPAITFLRVSTPRTESHDGPSGLASPRYQINCWSETHTEASDLAVAVRKTVHGYRGTSEGVRIDGILAVGERDDIDLERGVQRVITDWKIWHNEATT